MDDHIRSASSGQHTYAACVCELSPQTRETLGKAARSKKGSWFKSVTKMEEAARDIVFPNLATADETFRNTISAIQQWMFRGP